MSTGAKRVLFIDRDGALLLKPSDRHIDSLQKVRLIPGVIPALARLRDAGYTFVMVSNQESPIAEDLQEVQHFLHDLLSSQGVAFDAELVGPHRQAGPLEDYLRSNAIDVHNSYLIGDGATNRAFARNLGVQAVSVRAGQGAGETWTEIARRLATGQRIARVERRTKETQITVELNLDYESPIQVSTGLGFFDHMLEQIAKHGGFSLQLSCTGDLHIDEHHTVEDCALALGQALKAALGDKRGVHRYGFLLPMDEALAQVAIDLSGRPYFVFEGRFGRDQVGQLPTELVPHFFRSLADALGAAINLKVTGENTHHMIEACFKGVGRALRQAVRITDAELPTTKGLL
jgi:imidazoleglycerol-phosphate dehydratase / histidinol-phosphatase